MEGFSKPLQLSAVSLEEINQGVVSPEGIQLGGVTDDGIVISNLPLLFADGNPTSLAEFSVKQLEKFIPYMIKCSTRNYKAQDIPTPKWWPVDLPFSVSLKKPLYLDNAHWLALLKSLVCRCYTHHGCEFMLRFCSNLSAISSTTLRYVNGWNGTTSLYNRHSGKLAVTFRNDNRYYDTKREFLRPLLPKSQMPRPDILLQATQYNICPCYNRAGEFDTLQIVNDHEKMCCQEEANISTTSASPEDLFPKQQQLFLNYFSLKSVDLEEELNEKKTPVLGGICKRRFPLGVTLTRCCAIPFSSPLGVIVHKKSRMAEHNTQVFLNRMERYCDGKISQLKYRSKERKLNEISQDLDWPVTWKPQLPKKGKEAWREQYSFLRSQRKQKRLFRSNPMQLDKKSQELLKLCRPVTVLLTRLTTEEITRSSTSPNLMKYSPCNFRLPKLLPNIVYTYSEHTDELGGFSIEPLIPVIDLCSADEGDSGENVTNDSFARE